MREREGIEGEIRMNFNSNFTCLNTIKRVFYIERILHLHLMPKGNLFIMVPLSRSNYPSPLTVTCESPATCMVYSPPAFYTMTGPWAVGLDLNFSYPKKMFTSFKKKKRTSLSHCLTLLTWISRFGSEI